MQQFRQANLVEMLSVCFCALLIINYFLSVAGHFHQLSNSCDQTEYYDFYSNLTQNLELLANYSYNSDESTALAQLSLKPCKFDLAHQTKLQNPYPEYWRDKYLEDTEKFLTDFSQMYNDYIEDFVLAGIRAKIHAMVYSDLFIHKYDKFSDLRQSGGPNVDQDKCLAQLKELTERYEEYHVKGWLNSRDVNMLHWLDIHGKAETGMVSGKTYMTGSYHECLDFKIQLKTSGETETRFCVASLTRPQWTAGKAPSAQYHLLKVGLCLPKACDSMKYKNKYDLVKNFVHIDARPSINQGFRVESLYCLPDEESKLTNWLYNPKAVVMVALVTVWLAVLVYATVREERERNLFRLKLRNESRAADKPISDEELSRYSPEELEKIGLKQCAKDTGSKGNSTPPESDQQAGGDKKATTFQRRQYTVYRCLAVTSNFRSLFNVSKTSSLVEPEESKAKHVNLDSIEGIKVLSMWYIIMAHVVMSATVAISNGRDLSRRNLIYYLINVAPAFAVNSFFCITGVITSYYILKKRQAVSMVRNPSKWIAFILYRYLRIMPIYLVVVAYTKILARYMGSGPFWDYGTSSMGQRLRCEEESWLLTILFGANFEKPLDQCIPSAWYLANDFQFFLVTPIFLALLEKSPRLGQMVLKLSILAGLGLGFVSIYMSDVSDLRPIANFMLHGFKHYVTHLSENYTQPQYRIPAYLCGLLFGYKLFEYEAKKLEYQAKKSDPENKERLVEPDWPDLFKTKGYLIGVLCLLISILTPLVGSHLPFTKNFARFMVALVMPLNHVLFASAVGIYLMLAATGNVNPRVNKILGSPLWKPMSRLSLCAVLTNIEVINYLTQTSTHPFFFEFRFQLVFSTISIMMTYLVSTVLCVLFEAPMRALLNRVLSGTMKRLSGDRVQRTKRD